MVPTGLLPPPSTDGQIWLTTAQAAAELRVAPCTITAWRHKGYITPHPASPPRHPMYSLDDLLCAEQTARQAALRTSGTLKRVRRDRPPAVVAGLPPAILRRMRTILALVYILWACIVFVGYVLWRRNRTRTAPHHHPGRHRAGSPPCRHLPVSGDGITVECVFCGLLTRIPA